MLLFYHLHAVLKFFQIHVSTVLVLLVEGWYSIPLQEVNNIRVLPDTRNTTSLFIFVSSHALLYHRNLHLSCTCSCTPSLPCSVIQPFRILDQFHSAFRPLFCSIPFRFIPFREIATIYLCVTFVHTHPASLSSQTILPSRAYETQCLCYVLLGNVKEGGVWQSTSESL